MANKIINDGSGALNAINTGGGAIHQTQINVNGFSGISTELTPDVKDELKQAEKIFNGPTRFRLNDFVTHEDSIIEGKRFENVEILGPCTIKLLGGSIELIDCQWFNSPDSLFIQIPEDQNFLQGVIGLINCTFVNCVFKNVAIAAKPRELIELKGQFGLKD